MLISLATLFPVNHYLLGLAFVQNHDVCVRDFAERHVICSIIRHSIDRFLLDASAKKEIDNNNLNFTKEEELTRKKHTEKKFFGLLNGRAIYSVRLLHDY